MINKLNCFKKNQQITKFRISDRITYLLIEKGRELKIQRENRLCTVCNSLDNEKHFFLYCEKNKIARQDYVGYISLFCNENPSFIGIPNLNDADKLKIILAPSTPEQEEKLSSLFKQSSELRTGV